MSRVSAPNTHSALYTGKEKTQPVTSYLSVPRADSRSTREDRTLELYAGLGRFIQEASPGIFSVSSQDGRRTYKVRYGGELKSCSCADQQIRGGSCVHLLAVGFHHATRRQRRRRRSHTFECSSCASRLPIAQAVVVGAEEASWTAFSEGELVCGPCGRSEGVI